MKLKNYILFNEKFQASLHKLAQIDLDLGQAIPLARSIREIGQESLVIFPIRDRIFSECGVKIGANLGDLPQEQKVELDTKIAELLETEFEITLSDKITLDQDQIKGKLSADDLLTLTEIVDY